MGSKDKDQSQGFHGHTGKNKRAARARGSQQHHRGEHEKPAGNHKQETHKPHSQRPCPRKVNALWNSRRSLKYHNRARFNGTDVRKSPQTKPLNQSRISSELKIASHSPPRQAREFRMHPIRDLNGSGGPNPRILLCGKMPVLRAGVSIGA